MLASLALTAPQFLRNILRVESDKHALYSATAVSFAVYRYDGPTIPAPVAALDLVLYENGFVGMHTAAEVVIPAR